MSKNSNTQLLEDAVADARMVLDTAIENAEATLTENFRGELKNLISEHIEDSMDEEFSADGDGVDSTDLSSYRDENSDQDDEDRYDNYSIDDIDDVLGEMEEKGSDFYGEEEDGHEPLEEEDNGEEKEVDVEPEDYEDEEDEEEMEESMSDIYKEIRAIEDKLASLTEEEEDYDEEQGEEPGEQDTGPDEYEDEEDEDMDEQLEIDIDELVNEYIDGQMDSPNRADKVSVSDPYDEEEDMRDAGEGVPAGSTFDIEGGHQTYDLHGDITESDDIDDMDIKDILDEIDAESKESDTLAENAELQAQNSKLRRQIKEYHNTVKKLREKLQKINLLNAKLLYANKLFRNFDLSENQKVKVIKRFDEASKASEAKLIFKTLADSLGDTVGKKQVNESVNRQINGSQKSTRPSGDNVITESDEIRKRFKKLANINENK